MLVFLSASTTNIFFKKSHHNYLTLSLTPKYMFWHFTSLLFLCRHPQKEVFVMLWYSFGDIFWKFGYQNLPTHTHRHANSDSSNKCKQAESLLSSCSRWHTRYISIYGGATSSVLHSQLHALRIVAQTVFVCRRALDISSWCVLKALIS